MQSKKPALVTSSSENVVMEDRLHKLTGSDFETWVDSESQRLGEEGVGRGTPIMVVMNNDLASIIAFYAAVKLEATIFIGNPFIPITRITNLVSKYRLAYISASKAICSASAAQLNGQTALCNSPSSNKLQRALLRTGETSHNIKLPHEAHIAIFSSGSTGEPKAIIHSYSSLSLNAISHAEAVGLTAQDVVGCVLPLYYSYGLVGNLIAAIETNAKIVLNGSMSGVDKQWVDENKVSFVSLTPFYAKQVTLDNLSMRVITLGGDALDIADAKMIKSRHPNCELYSTYGLTEAGPRVATWRFDNCELPETKFAPLGNALSCCEFYINVNDTHDSEAGELVIKTQTKMVGYYYGYDKEIVFPPEWIGKIFTGDIFELVDGQHYFAGRDKDLIVQNGEKIFPSMVEASLLKIEGVTDARVFGLDDEEKGQVAEAFIRLSPEHSHLKESELKMKLLEFLPRYSIPENFYFVDEIKRSPTGKNLPKSEAIMFRQQSTAQSKRYLISTQNLG